jgi:site-specific DNA-methyltransferase (adenine-specific)
LLKPAAEHWILIKAPGELRELRIEENRIGTEKRVPGSPPKAANLTYGARPASAADESTAGYDANVGRWPANFALSHSDECDDVCGEGCPVKMLNEQSGELKSGGFKAGGKRGALGYMGNPQQTLEREIPPSVGSASRFFYQAKPSTKERSTGLPSGSRNTHTTVKSIALMQHLINLVAAPGELILDPFTGSGSTGVAALANGCRFIGIEREAEYIEIARQRVYAASQK